MNHGKFKGEEFRKECKGKKRSKSAKKKNPNNKLMVNNFSSFYSGKLKEEFKNTSLFKFSLCFILLYDYHEKPKTNI